jgi:hypothetical protein
MSSESDLNGTNFRHPDLWGKRMACLGGKRGADWCPDNVGYSSHIWFVAGLGCYKEAAQIGKLQEPKMEAGRKAWPQARSWNGTRK